MLCCEEDYDVLKAFVSVPVSYTHLDVYKRQPTHNNQPLSLYIKLLQITCTESSHYSLHYNDHVLLEAFDFSIMI